MLSSNINSVVTTQETKEEVNFGSKNWSCTQHKKINTREREKWGGGGGSEGQVRGKEGERYN